MTIKQHPAYLYAVALVNDDIAQGVERVDHPVNAWVRAQAQEFLDVCDGKDKKYCINEKKLRKIGKLMKLMQMPSGLVAGKSIYEATSGYQWLFYAAVLCVVYRNDLKRRRYETAVLEICRKNFKTFTVAVCFLLLMLTEPRFAKLFSVAPDGALSREVQKAIKEILRSSPALMPPDDPNKYFKILRDKITFKLKDTEYTPLNYSNSRLDGRLPNVFLVDEAGALPNPYAIEAMRSGQLTILNKLGCIISTKYPRSDNPFEDEVAYAKNVLEGRVQNEALFALLFEPEESIQKQWATNNNVLAQGNPAALTLPTVWEDLLNRRQKAVEQESTRENFLCKHCNIIYQGAGTESYIPIDVVQACRVDDIQWAGCEVYLGVDLSMSNDNCAVAMVGLIGDRIAARVMGFIPADKVDEKTSLITVWPCATANVLRAGTAPWTTAQSKTGCSTWKKPTACGCRAWPMTDTTRFPAPRSGSAGATERKASRTTDTRRCRCGSTATPCTRPQNFCRKFARAGGLPTRKTNCWK